jgi:hypothetical protein
MVTSDGITHIRSGTRVITDSNRKCKVTRSYHSGDAVVKAIELPLP